MTVELTKGKITASKDVLNSISIVFFEAAEKYKNQGCPALASDAEENSHKIYAALNASGYFKGC